MLITYIYINIASRCVPFFNYPLGETFFEYLVTNGGGGNTGPDSASEQQRNRVVYGILTVNAHLKLVQRSAPERVI